MAYAIVFKDSAARELRKLPRHIQPGIISAIDALAENPRPFGYEKLTDKRGFKFRVGNYRIVYDIKDKTLTVEILRVADRKESYRDRK